MGATGVSAGEGVFPKGGEKYRECKVALKGYGEASSCWEKGIRGFE